MIDNNRIVQVLLVFALLNFIEHSVAQNSDVELQPASTVPPSIIEGPANETKSVGNLTFCTCTYNGTSDYPFWRINDTSYAVTELPEYYEVNSSGILFPAFDFLDNTSYQCYFIYCDPNQAEECTEIASYPGRLDVLLVISNGTTRPPNCRHRFPGILVHDGTVTLHWVPPDMECVSQTQNYTIETATCQSSYIMRECYRDIFETQASFPNSYCSITKQPLLFRTRGNTQSQETDVFSSYVYFVKVNNTEMRRVNINETVRFMNLSRGTTCVSDYQICINGTEFQNCIPLSDSELPDYHYTCGGDLCIDVNESNFKSLNNTVYTILCPTSAHTLGECEDSELVNLVGYNFQLIITDMTNNESKTCPAACIIGIAVGIAVIAIGILVVCCYYYWDVLKKKCKCCCKAQGSNEATLSSVTELNRDK